MRLSHIIAAPVFSVVLLLTVPGAAPAQSQPKDPDAESAAIKKVCADFSDGFTRHDPHGVAMNFIEDGDFTNMNGNHSRGRKDIENWFVNLFRGNLRDAHRTDTVRSIRFFTPELAGVDADTVISGTKTADGSEVPPRKALMILLMTKQNGHWYIGSFHEAEYPPPRGGSANGPAAKSTN